MTDQATSVAEFVSLTQEQIQFFRQNGYLTVDSIASPKEIEGLQGVYDRLFVTKAGRELGHFYDLAGRDDDQTPQSLPQLMHPSRYAPELAAGQFRDNAIAIAKQLLGPQCEFRQDFAICKPAGSTATTPWHQDIAYHDPWLDYEALTIWIPLQEVNADNGCLQFIPGSHLYKEVLPHHPINNDPAIEGLECDLDPQLARQAVLAPLPLGGASIHHLRTLHFAGANNTQSARRAYILEFRMPPVRRAVPRNQPWQEGRTTNRAKRAARLKSQIQITMSFLKRRAQKLFKQKS